MSLKMLYLYGYSIFDGIGMGFNNTNLSAKDRIVLALDTDSLDEVERLVKLLKDYVGWLDLSFLPRVLTMLLN